MVMVLEKQITVRSEWLSDEMEYLKANYGRIPNENIYAHLNRHTPNQIKAKACSFGLKSLKYWKEEDLNYVNENLGIIPDEEIIKHLKRSKNALHLVTVRRLHINHKVNMYTSREVALLLGVSCSKTIIEWKNKGWIKGKRSTIHCGGNFIWNFSYEAIEDCLNKRPWLVDCSKMELSYFRSIVKDKYAKDPWFSIKQACQMIGVAYQSCAMTFYVKKKWLHPVKKPCEWGNHWTYLFFRSDIEMFLKDDPRNLRPLQMGDTRRKQNFKAGKAVRVMAIFKMKCPKCNKTVRITTSSTRLEGPAVKKLFIEKYNQGKICDHGRLCQVEKALKPYVIRKSKNAKL